MRGTSSLRQRREWASGLSAIGRLTSRRLRHMMATGLMCVAAALTALVTAAPRAHAEIGLVLIESLSAPAGDLRAMDYVAQGTTVDLGASTVIVLDHLATCTREAVTGGILHVESPNSRVEGGSVARSQLDCDGHQLQLDAAKAQGGGQVYRVIDQRPLVLHGTAPVILAKHGGMVRIERDDQPSPAIEVQVPEPPKGQTVTIDLALSHQELAPGGRYRIIVGAHQETFVVDPGAAGGAGVPLLARLLPI